MSDINNFKMYPRCSEVLVFSTLNRIISSIHIIKTSAWFPVSGTKVPQMSPLCSGSNNFFLIIFMLTMWGLFKILIVENWEDPQKETELIVDFQYGSPKFFLPGKITYLHVSGIMMWTFWRPIATTCENGKQLEVLYIAVGA